MDLIERQHRGLQRIAETILVADGLLEEPETPERTDIVDQIALETIQPRLATKQPSPPTTFLTPRTK